MIHDQTIDSESENFVIMNEYNKEGSHCHT